MSEQENNNEPINEVEQLWRLYRQNEENRRNMSAAKLKELAAPLRTLGITQLYWSYDGQGDSGDIDRFEIQGVGSGPRTEAEYKEAIKAFGKELADKLSIDHMKDCVFELLPAGFEINEGGYGEVTLNTTTGALRIEHNERIQEINTSEYTF